MRIFDRPAIVVSEVEKKWSTKINSILEEKRKALERCEEEIIIRRARVKHLEGINLDDQGDQNQWRKKIPALPVWRQKAKKHVGKRFGSKVDLDMSKKTKIEDPLICCSPAQRVRLLSTSEGSNNDEQINAEGSGQAPSALELVSIVTVQSLVKPREEEGVDLRAFRDLEELLDEAFPSGSKESSSFFSGPKFSMKNSSPHHLSRIESHQSHSTSLDTQ